MDLAVFFENLHSSVKGSFQAGAKWKKASVFDLCESPLQKLLLWTCHLHPIVWPFISRTNKEFSLFNVLL